MCNTDNTVGYVLKVGMQQKLQYSFPPYCDSLFLPYISEWNGFSSQKKCRAGNVLDGCVSLLVDLMWETGGVECCCKREGKFFWLKITSHMSLKN